MRVAPFARMLIEQFSSIRDNCSHFTAKCSGLKTMYRYVGITLLLVLAQNEGAPSPLRVTIDCSSEEREYGRSNFRRRPSNSNSRSDVSSFCSLIQNAIPDAVKDGRFVVLDNMDQEGFSDTQVPISVAPPQGFIPKYNRFKTPKVRVPKLKVPTLRAQDGYSAPTIGKSMSFSSLRSSRDDDSSAERMEIFKKGVQKMLHVVKVLGQIDQYISERTRIVIDKLAKTFAD